MNLTLTNVSSGDCTLHGWPALGVVLRGGRRPLLGAGHIPNATSTGASVRARLVVLRPTGAASFNVMVLNQLMLDHPPKCVSPQATLVTPPGAHTALRIRPFFNYCGRGFESVTPLVPGRLDRYQVG